MSSCSENVWRKKGNSMICKTVLQMISRKNSGFWVLNSENGLTEKRKKAWFRKKYSNWFHIKIQVFELFCYENYLKVKKPNLHKTLAIKIFSFFKDDPDINT